MNYPDAIEFLDSFINYEKERSFSYPEAFKLERMERLAKALGNPQNAYECVLVAGSKGKGSTAAILASILRMENLRVGLYTSPHLLDLRERIQVNGLWIGEPRLVLYAEELRRVLNDAAWRRDPPTYFEVLTALAFRHFKEMEVRVAVLEVGLGGLYDSTNIARAKVVGLAPISLEHTDKLGKTVSKIAVQKCGIIKGREIVVSAPQVREADAVIEQASREREATLVRVGKDIRVLERDSGEDFQKFDVRTPWGDFYGLELELRGSHQIENAALAVGLAQALVKKARLTLSDGAVRQGVRDVRWRGRLEKISDHPKIVVDGAHNADSVRRMVEGLKKHFHYGRLVTVLGVSQDKDLAGMLETLLPETSFLIVTQARNPRAMPAKIVAEAVREKFQHVEIQEDPLEALERAKKTAGAGDLILVTGSLFLAADILSAVSQEVL